MAKKRYVEENLWTESERKQYLIRSSKRMNRLIHLEVDPKDFRCMFEQD